VKLMTRMTFTVVRLLGLSGFWITVLLLIYFSSGLF
jgi:hypothetical protein